MQMTPMINCVHGFANIDRGAAAALEFVLISSAPLLLPMGYANT
jgi:hypothetical protein